MVWKELFSALWNYYLLLWLKQNNFQNMITEYFLQAAYSENYWQKLSGKMEK